MKKIKLSSMVFLILIVIGCSLFVFRENRMDPISKVARYPYRVIAQADIDHDIEAMEKKVQVGDPQPVELGMLAALYFAQGKLTGNSSWYDKAEQTAQKSLKIQKDSNIGSRLVLAKVMASRHEFAQSIKIALEANKDDASKTSALAIIATSYLATGDLNQAGIYADRFVDTTPGLESYGLRGLIMDAQGRSDEATSDFIRALEIEDLGESQESAWVRSMFARSLMRSGDYKHAKILLDEALRTVPHYHLALDILGELNMRQGDYENAEKNYKAAFESSRQLAYLSHYSKLAIIKGEEQLATEIQNQAEFLIRAEIAKNGCGHRLDLASILIDRGDPKDIQEALTLAREDTQNRRSAIALSVLARAELVAGNSKEALLTMRELLRSGIKDPDYYYQMSTVEHAVKNPRLTAFYLNQATKTDPNNRLFQK